MEHESSSWRGEYSSTNAWGGESITGLGGDSWNGVLRKKGAPSFYAGRPGAKGVGVEMGKKPLDL